MTAFAYLESPVPVRADIIDAHRLAWREIAARGNWWTGSERVAIADEARRAGPCVLCNTRLDAQLAVEGEHDHAGLLPPEAVEAVHRITRNPALLNKDWFDGLISPAFTDGHYVEMVGIVVTVCCIDTMHRGLGVALEPLPEPLPGEPSRYRPQAAKKSNQAWVPMITARAAAGTPEADLYAGESGNVIYAMSLVPDAVRLLNITQKAHYVDFAIDHFTSATNRALSRPQLELIAGRISVLNDCFY